MTDAADPAVSADTSAADAPQVAPVADDKTFHSLIQDETVRTHAQRYKTIEDLARGSLEARQVVSQSIRLPGENATDDERAEFRTKLGTHFAIPETVEGYDYQAPDLPDYLKPADGDGGLSERLAHYHGLGLNKEQVQGVLDHHFKDLVDSAAGYNDALIQERQDKEVELRVKWGGDYDRNVELSKRASATYGTEGLNDFLTQTIVGGVQLANHPEIVEFFTNVAKATMESSIPLVQGETEKKAANARYQELTEQIYAANQANDHALMRRLDAERSALTLG